MKKYGVTGEAGKSESFPKGLQFFHCLSHNSYQYNSTLAFVPEGV